MNILDKLYDPAFRIPPWLWGALGLHDPEHDRRLGPWYDFLTHEALQIDGDIAEFGVYKGDSLITAAVLLKRVGSTKTIHGFDTFTGFPFKDPIDDPAEFHELSKRCQITESHYAAVRLLAAADAQDLHRRHKFSDTSGDYVLKRLLRFHIRHACLYSGTFDRTISRIENVRFAAVLLDCDLYQSYKDVLPFAWEHLSDGGMIYLDEYYSLKYPGPRIAVNEFCATIGVKPQRILGHSRPGEFERWCLRK